MVVVPKKGAQILEPETVADSEVEVESDPGDCGTGTDPRVLVGVGMAPVLVPPWPGMRAVDLDGRRLPFGIDAVGIKAVLPVPVEVTPRTESTLDTRLPTRSPGVVVPVGVGVANGELVANAGTLTGMVGELYGSEDTVALVLLPVEDLSPKPKRAERSDPELAMLEAALLILLALEDPVGVADTEVVDSPRMPPNPEVRSPRTLSLEDAKGVEEADEVTLADKSETGVVKDVEPPPTRLPTFEVKSLRRPPLDVAVAEEIGEVTTADEPEAGAAVEEIESTPRILPTFEVKLLRRPSLDDVVAAAAAVEVGEVTTADEPEVGIAVEDTALLPRRLPTFEVKSLKRLSLDDVVAAAAVEVAEVTTADEPEAGIEVEDMTALEDVEVLPRRLPTSEVKSLRIPPLDDVAAAAAAVEVTEGTTAGESETGVVVEDVVEDVVAAAAAEVGEDTRADETGVVVGEIESTPSILPTFEVKSPRIPSLEVVAEGDVVAASADESTTDPCWLVAPASVDAASEFCVLVFSVLEPSVCCVVVVVVLVGSPPIVVVPVIRWVISGFLGSIEMVTITTSCPCWG